MPTETERLQQIAEEEYKFGFYTDIDAESLPPGTYRLKALRRAVPDYPLWRDFPYEYTSGRLPIDTINGGPLLREWVDDPEAGPADLETAIQADEEAWLEESRPYRLY